MQSLLCSDCGLEITDTQDIVWGYEGRYLVRHTDAFHRELPFCTPATHEWQQFTTDFDICQACYETRVHP